MDVSIIIVNYNTCKMTLECIDSICERTSGIVYEIIVVDNASVDGSRQLLGQDKRIHYLYSERNLGFGPANNLGLKYAKGRNIFFLNSDTLLINNAITILSDYLDQNENVGVCGGNLYSKEQKPTRSFARFLPSAADVLNEIFLKLPSRIVYGKSLYFNFTNCASDVAYITGADLMMKRKVLDEVGSFNPAFFMYYEETELCFRVRNTGYRLVSVPWARIIHLGGGSFDNTATVNEKRVSSQIESFKCYLSLTHSDRGKNWVSFLFRVLILERLLLYKIQRNRKKIALWKYVKRIF